MEMALHMLENLSSGIIEVERNKVDPSSEKDLIDIKKTLSGDDQAFSRLLKRYEGVVTAWMWRFTRDPNTLAELVQEVFVQAYFSLGSYKARAKFKTWLLAIATRVGYAHFKNIEREKKKEAAASQWFKQILDEKNDPGPEEAAEVLHNVFKELPAKERLVLTLSYFQDMNTKDIAEVTGFSQSLVKVRAYRARKKLKVLLGEAGFGGNNNE
jgi:RNA polymerase sigma-70 factor, ECF subfamily